VAGSADAQAFFASINKALAASQNSDLVVYVHGANNTVARVQRRRADRQPRSGQARRAAAG